MGRRPRARAGAPHNNRAAQEGRDRIRARGQAGNDRLGAGAWLRDRSEAAQPCRGPLGPALRDGAATAPRCVPGAAVRQGGGVMKTEVRANEVMQVIGAIARDAIFAGIPAPVVALRLATILTEALAFIDDEEERLDLTRKIAAGLPEITECAYQLAKTIRHRAGLIPEGAA